MTNLFNEYFSFFEKFSNEFGNELSDLNVGILDDFIKNKVNIKRFHEKYVIGNKPHIMLVGINPGRFGAGKTGIPFLDFDSLSKLLPDIDSNESERSSKFIFDIIEDIGVEKFYQQCHISNLSWFGFYDLTNIKNVNYNLLPKHIATVLLDNFVEEVKFIDPSVIIPISDIVNWELTLNLRVKGKIDTIIENRLYHPATKYANKADYLKVLNKYLIS